LLFRKLIVKKRKYVVIYKKREDDVNIFYKKIEIVSDFQVFGI
jgi:hypothetical protein